MDFWHRLRIVWWKSHPELEHSVLVDALLNEIDTLPVCELRTDISRQRVCWHQKDTVRGVLLQELVLESKDFKSNRSHTPLSLTLRYIFCSLSSWLIKSGTFLFILLILSLGRKHNSRLGTLTHRMDWFLNLIVVQVPNCRITRRPWNLVNALVHSDCDAFLGTPSVERYRYHRGFSFTLHVLMINQKKVKINNYN